MSWRRIKQSLSLPNKLKERFWWPHLLTAFFPLLIPEHNWLPARLFLSYISSRIHPNIFLAEEFSDEKGGNKNRLEKQDRAKLFLSTIEAQQNISYFPSLLR